MRRFTLGGAPPPPAVRALAGEGAGAPLSHAAIRAALSNGTHARGASITMTSTDVRAARSRFCCARQRAQSQSCAARLRIASGTSMPSPRTSPISRFVCSTTHSSERKTGMNPAFAGSVSSSRRRRALSSKSSMKESISSRTLRRVSCRTSWRCLTCIDSSAAANCRKCSAAPSIRSVCPVGAVSTMIRASAFCSASSPIRIQAISSSTPGSDSSKNRRSSSLSRYVPRSPSSRNCARFSPRNFEYSSSAHSASIRRLSGCRVVELSKRSPRLDAGSVVKRIVLPVSL